MPITINTNVSAMISQRNLSAASTRSASSLSKLASGSRVPTAKEDAASLAVGTGLSLDVSALRAAQVNAQQGSSLLQVADGAFSQISDILTRMKSLATTAQSGQLSGTERGFLDQEYGLLRQEIDRIAATTEFNGQLLLGGSDTLVVDGTDVNAQTGGTAGTATALFAEDGFSGFSFDASIVTNGDQFAVFYDDSTGNLTVNNVTQGEAQTVNLGAAGDTAVALGTERVVSFSSIGVEITLNDQFNIDGAGDTGVAIGSGQDIGTISDLDGTDATVVFGAITGAGTQTQFSENIQVGINATNDDRIDVTIALGDFSSLIGGGAGTNLSNVANAAIASAEVDAAVTGTDGVNQARAAIGANLNKLEFAQNNLAVSIENLEAARSVLLDVDVSMEITKFTSEQVLIQAGVSMLAQANQQPSLLLRLLQ